MTQSLPCCEICFSPIVIMTAFFCLALIVSLPLSPQPRRRRCCGWAQHSPRECKKRRKSMEKILLRAHTFLSGFERVSFNFSLISICCFWESSAAHLTRRNKLSPGFSYKRPFQLRPLFCLYVPVSMTTWGIYLSKQVQLFCKTLFPPPVLRRDGHTWVFASPEHLHDDDAPGKVRVEKVVCSGFTFWINTIARPEPTWLKTGTT